MNVLLGFLTLVVMFAVAYAYFREGMFTGFTMCFNVLLAGLVAFNFGEPLAEQLDRLFSGTFLVGYVDLASLVLLFCLALGVLRLVTNNLAMTEPQLPPAVVRGGGAFFGLVTGYLVSGFLVCALQTLPWHENFLGFEWSKDKKGYYELAPVVRRPLPPDQVWLSLMYRCSVYAFAPADPGGEWFLANYPLRFAYYRRYGDRPDPPPPSQPPAEEDPNLDLKRKLKARGP